MKTLVEYIYSDILDFECDTEQLAQNKQQAYINEIEKDGWAVHSICEGSYNSRTLYSEIKMYKLEKHELLKEADELKLLKSINAFIFSELCQKYNVKNLTKSVLTDFEYKKVQQSLREVAKKSEYIRVATMYYSK